MAIRHISPKVSISAAIISFGVALISFLGIILKNDSVGRLIFGSTWTLLGVVWLGQYFHAKKEGKTLQD